MAKLLQIRRGTTAQHASFTGAEGEITVDTTKDTVVNSLKFNENVGYTGAKVVKETPEQIEARKQAAEQARKEKITLDPFFGPKANEENAVDKLQVMYPNIPMRVAYSGRESIFVGDEQFYLRGYGDQTPEMEKERLAEHLKALAERVKALEQLNPK